MLYMFLSGLVGFFIGFWFYGWSTKENKKLEELGKDSSYPTESMQEPIFPTTKDRFLFKEGEVRHRVRSLVKTKRPPPPPPMKNGKGEDVPLKRSL